MPTPSICPPRRITISVRLFRAFGMLSFFIVCGCHVSPPGGDVIQPEMLGTTVDQINMAQEHNAELAKLIVYAHEFEINLQEDPSSRASAEKSKSTFDYHAQIRPHGLRLTPAGEDHVRQIASQLRQIDHLDAMPQVIVERSSTSRRWDTDHHYPVHRNTELDSMRRQVVVHALDALGVPQADEIVLVAPAFPTGLNAAEAESAYYRSMTWNRQTRW